MFINIMYVCIYNNKRILHVKIIYLNVKKYLITISQKTIALM